MAAILCQKWPTQPTITTRRLTGDSYDVVDMLDAAPTGDRWVGGRGGDRVEHSAKADGITAAIDIGTSCASATNMRLFDHEVAWLARPPRSVVRSTHLDSVNGRSLEQPGTRRGKEFILDTRRGERARGPTLILDESNEFVQ
jgi:hypothetical protein